LIQFVLAINQCSGPIGLLFAQTAAGDYI
jgi:hypothetical protein